MCAAIAKQITQSPGLYAEIAKYRPTLKALKCMQK